MKCLLSPEVRGNAGCYRPFTVKVPAGSVLNCDKPASVNLRTRVGWYLAPNIFRALADAAPDRVQAATGLRSPSTSMAARRRCRLCRPFLHGRRPGRVSAWRRQVGSALSDIGGEHLDRTDGDARTRSGAGENFRNRFGRPGAIAAAAACGRGCANCTTTVCRLWLPSIRGRWRHGGGFARWPARGDVRGVVVDPTGNVLRIAAPANLSR